MKKITAEWIQYAENDYFAATILLTSHKPPYEIIAYHCQQAVEKYLKSILAESNQSIPKTHDLGFILDLVIVIYPEMKDLSEICDRLTPFGIVTRYPGSSMTVSNSHMDFLLSSVEKVRSAIIELADNL